MWYETRAGKTRTWLRWRAAPHLNMSDAVCYILRGSAVLLHAYLNNSCNSVIAVTPHSIEVSILRKHPTDDRARCAGCYIAQVGRWKIQTNFIPFYYLLRTVEFHFSSDLRLHSGLPPTQGLCYREAQKQAYHHHVLHNVRDCINYALQAECTGDWIVVQGTSVAV